MLVEARWDRVPDDLLDVDSVLLEADVGVAHLGLPGGARDVEPTAFSASCHHCALVEGERSIVGVQVSARPERKRQVLRLVSRGHAADDRHPEIAQALDEDLVDRAPIRARVAAREAAERDPCDALEPASVPQGGEHSVYPVGGLPNVFQEEHRAPQRRRVGGADQGAEDGEVAPYQRPFRSPGSDRMQTGDVLGWRAFDGCDPGVVRRLVSGAQRGHHRRVQ